MQRVRGREREREREIHRVRDIYREGEIGRDREKMINSERKTVGYRVKNKINIREEGVRCFTVTELRFW